MQFHLFKDAKDPFCGLAAARGASWVFFLLLSLFCLPAPGWAFHRFFLLWCWIGWCFSGCDVVDSAALPRLEGNCVAVSRRRCRGYLATALRLVGITLTVMRLFAAVIGGGGNQPERLNAEGFSPSAFSRGGASSQLSECRPSREKRRTRISG